jgi:hypothetical protein
MGLLLQVVLNLDKSSAASFVQLVLVVAQTPIRSKWFFPFVDDLIECGLVSGLYVGLFK